MAAAIRVLYVDDESGLLEIGKLFLEHSGNFTVTTALSAADGIHLLGQEKFDAIISDYQMPGMDGIQFLVEVRKRFGPIPFILFTGRGREEVVIQAINRGADFYLQKGGEPEAQFAELAHKIKAAASSKRADDALRKSEEKYRHLIEHSNEAILVAQDGMLKRVNHRLIELLGYSEQELLSTQFPVFIHPDDRAMVVERYQKRLKGEEYPSRYSFRLNPKDGNIRWVEISAVVIEWDGRPATLNFLTDITERKVAEAAMRASHERLTITEADLRTHQIELEIQAEELRRSKLALEKSRDTYLDLYDLAPLGYFTISDKALITDVNLTGAKLLGVERSRLVKAPFSKFVTDRDTDEWHLFFMNVLNQKEKRTCTLMLKRGGGSLFPAQLEAVLIPGSDGANTVRIAIIDITERWRADEVLRESEKSYRGLFNTIRQAIYILNPDGTFVDVNEGAVAMYGYAREEFVGRTPEFLSAPGKNDLAAVMEYIREAFAGEPQLFGFWGLRKGGEIFPKDISLYKGTYFGKDVIVAVGADITERKVVEEALRESETKHRALFESIADTVFLIDQKTGNILDVNPAASRQYGFNHDEFVRMNAVDVSTEPEQTVSAIERPVSNIPLRYHHRKDGSIFPVELTASTFELQGKTIIIATARDITERKRDEEILRESEARFRKILEMAPLPLCYVNVNGVITFRNERFVQIFGYRADDVPTLTEWWQQAYPDAHYRQLVTTTWDAAVKRATEDGTDIKPVEYTVTCKSGEERIIEISGITLGEDFLATFIDLTERRRVEAAFRQLSADHKVIIDHAPAMVWYKDTKNNFIRVNPAGALAFGLPVEEIEGKNTYDLFPDFAEKYYQDDLDVINSGKPRLGIIEPMTTASGEHLWVQTDKIPLRDEQGTITGILLFAVDITSRKRAEEALALAIKKLALLSSITRHDILNQLTVLIGHLELLERKQPDPSFTTYFNIISRAADRINAMIQFTKEYESIGVHAPTWQETRSLVETAVKQAPLGKILLKNDLPAGAEVFADPLIVKVFYNLVENAARHGGKITTIRFSTEEQGADKVIICKDDGNGIPAEEKEKIFDLGFGKNSGLGLAISREILDITGITIRETGEPGKGARFEITVPKGMWRMAGKSD